MSARLKLWLAPLLLFTLFTFWYTDFGGPLSDKEIAIFLGRLADNGSDPQVISLIERFARSDSGRQFIMVNSIDLKDHPHDVPGAEAGESAEQLMGRYMAHMLPALLARACHPVLVGSTIFQSMDVVGIDGADMWDQGALVRYRSRRAFLEIVTNPVFRGKHHFKTAALEKTIAYPIETSLYPGDPRLLLGLFLVALTALLDAFWLARRKN